MSHDYSYTYADIDDFEVIKEFVIDIIDAKVDVSVKKQHLLYLIGLLEYGLLTDDVKAQLTKFSKFFVILLSDSQTNDLVARLLCSVISSNITKWQVDLVRQSHAKTGSKIFLALLRQIQMMRPSLVPDEGIAAVRAFPKLPKKMRELFECASENVGNKTFYKVTDSGGPPAKIARTDLVPVAPFYAEITPDLKANPAYVTQVEHFRDFAPLMPSLKLPNVIASCLREVNLHPVVAVKLSTKQRNELNRWIYLTLESELLMSLRTKKKGGMEYLLRLLKRFIAGTGTNLPGLFIILIEYLEDWNGIAYRSELFEVLPQLPLQLAVVEEINCGIIQPLSKIADGGDDMVKSDVIECIGKLIVNLRYKSYLMEKKDPEMAKSMLKNHHKLVGFFSHLCEKFLAEPSTGGLLFERMLIEYAVIFQSEMKTEVMRFTVLPKSLRLLIMYSQHLDLVAIYSTLLNQYLSKLSTTTDKETIEMVREAQAEVKEFLLPKGVRNLTNSLAFIPVIANYAKSKGIESLKIAASHVNENPSLVYPVLLVHFPAIVNLFLSIQNASIE